ncbi:MAG TPA: secondary thiamine-phosphate synthase enzyme YjbQ [Candidatus Bathyarchaeia archaeon]|nr:secondary thiamine-phosphate synthase enzyme YjbQ [Candidatus Bathyarchaeia archaeon]
MERIEIRTEESTELIDITREVKEIVSRKNVDSGVCVIFTKHTTTGVIINENEAGLKSDILKLLNELIPRGKGYMHDRIDNNANAHLRAVVLGSSVTIPIEKGVLALGTWQSILFVECDGPRRREVCVAVIEG